MSHEDPFEDDSVSTGCMQDNLWTAESPAPQFPAFEEEVVDNEYATDYRAPYAAMSIASHNDDQANPSPVSFRDQVQHARKRLTDAWRSWSNQEEGSPESTPLREHPLEAGLVTNPMEIETPGMNAERSWWSRITPRSWGYAVLICVALVAVVLITVEMFTVKAPARQPAHVHVEEQKCKTASCINATAHLLMTMDPAGDPCGDPYGFACNGWLKSYRLPSDRDHFSLSFSSVARKAQDRSRELLESRSCDSLTALNEDPWQARMVCYFEACQDVDSLGPEPLTGYLERELPWVLSDTPIDESDVDNVLGNRLQNVHLLGLPGVFSVGVEKNIFTGQGSVLTFAPGGLGLFFDEFADASLVVSYEQHLAMLLELFDAQHLLTHGAARARAKAVVHLEEQLRGLQLSPGERSDVVKSSTLMSWSRLTDQLDPAINMEEYIKGFKNLFRRDYAEDFGPRTKVLVQDPEYFSRLSEVLKAVPLKALEDYLLTRALSQLSPYLGGPWRTEVNRWTKLRTGMDRPPRWEACLGAVETHLGWVLARDFVADSGSKRAQAVEILGSIQAQFGEMLSSSPWMDAQTVSRASAKLEHLTHKLGYPEWLVTKAPEFFSQFYGPVEALNGGFFDQSMRLVNQAVRFVYGGVGRALDQRLWQMTPQTVNAYYSPPANEIVFPQAIFEEPFLFTWSDDDELEKAALSALSYGALGAVMGHEIVHGFDNQGRLYDAAGNLANWWTVQSANHFEERTQCLVDQYSQYTVHSGGKELHVNGQLTLGENIADNGGLKAAHRAYTARISPSEAGAMPLPGIDLTTDQLFFLAFSTTWCTVNRDQYAAQAVNNDPHSPGPSRVLGTLQNTAEYSHAFECAPGTLVFPFEDNESRCYVW
ncbi:MAG: hypothetical protein KVP17_000029 [Porospora cf. gigantea B]|uniref:uncharacterized protein n=1 Tax=Porospora cf. gigantea B TaxID=2853592 RepID=UPI0035719020|nr:MAG: hypothetical protein KVP17_000029 [Porospora cf. gigantea B]